MSVSPMLETSPYMSTKSLNPFQNFSTSDGQISPCQRASSISLGEHWMLAHRCQAFPSGGLEIAAFSEVPPLVEIKLRLIPLPIFLFPCLLSTLHFLCSPLVKHKTTLTTQHYL